MNDEVPKLIVSSVAKIWLAITIAVTAVLVISLPFQAHLFEKFLIAITLLWVVFGLVKLFCSLILYRWNR